MNGKLSEAFDAATTPGRPVTLVVTTTSTIHLYGPIPHGDVLKEVNRRIARAIPGRHTTFIPKSSPEPTSAFPQVHSGGGFAEPKG